jgi:hypothetical protein
MINTAVRAKSMLVDVTKGTIQNEKTNLYLSKDN